MALEASVRAAMDRKLQEMKPAMEEARLWIEAVTEERMADEKFDEWLRSGVILCKLVNKIVPNSVRKVNKGAMPFVQMENISSFIRAIKALGVKPESCFDTVDLYKGQDIAKVIQTIHAFGSVVQTNIKSYNGPQLGVKLSQENKRNFTAEQLAASKMATSKVSQGSAEYMQRSEVLQPGITFGNKYVGGAGSNEVSKATAGSAGIMQRSEIQKPGITFGNSAAGTGATDVPSVATSGLISKRDEPSKPGITFGHASAGGSGSNEVSSKLNSGLISSSPEASAKPGITFGHDASNQK
eukprot:CAMPEP_0197302754 /NCGR_PEP_ID=MMETSP0890-20130614/51246_1 /TAXON_ID=44058 ORGANISM="Aureoumbra lagunensis, Strain CCMP1510" /NCGR_SAMPLE_ID=MMETSP0890 /ASSEMBLY_ACC=CAM_ASM_000533 /LENGTH=296 /DNA_ID=CAMNT_0042782441 /DNA_START=76 /DNA_END=966 /DNA_ORIENTATION=+